MTIRARYYLAVLPLFAALAAANALLLFSLHERETRWGVEEHGKSAALTLASFAGHAAPGRTAALAVLRGASERYARVVAPATGVWFEPQGETLMPHSLFASEGIAPPPTPDARLLDRLRRREFVVRLVNQRDQPHDLVHAYAGVFGSGAGLRGIAAITLAETVRREDHREVALDCAKFAALVLLLAVIVAEFLTRLARRELDRLVDAAHALARGDRSPEIPPGRIRELNDIAGTLLTIGSSLHDSTQQTRLGLLHAKLAPRSTELEAAFVDLAATPAPEGSPFTLLRVGPLQPAEFIGERAFEGGFAAVVGRLAHAGPPDLDVAIRAVAARDFLLGLATAGPSLEAWPKIAPPFPCASVRLVLAPSGQPPRVFNVGTSGPVLAFTEERSPRGVEGTLAPPALQLAAQLLPALAGHPPGERAPILARLLASHPGALIVYPVFPDTASITLRSSSRLDHG